MRLFSLNPRRLSTGRFAVVVGISIAVSMFSAPAAVVLTWTGLGRNDGWSNAKNWSPNVTPGPGVDLVFDSDEPLVMPNDNDLSSMTFQSITFVVPGYDVTGLDFELTDGITVTHGAGVTDIQVPIGLSDQATIEVVNTQARLRLGSVGVFGGDSITFNNAGTIELSNWANNGSFSKFGTGLLEWYATETISPVGHIHQGTFRVLESPYVAPGCVLYPGGSLGGLGTVRYVDALSGGTVDPGTTSLGTLAVEQYARLASDNTTFRVVLHHKFGYDQLSVGQSVLLSGFGGANSCKLDIRLGRGFIPAIGQPFRIIDNQSPNPVFGRFAGLPENAITNIDGTHFQISYSGGTGNDIVLTIVSVDPTGIKRVWDGGGADIFWTTPENWVGDQAPNPGDDLEFPEGAAQPGNNNDYPFYTAFNSITLAGGGYTLGGHPVGLSAGLHAMNPSGANTVKLALRLSADQTFNNNAPAGLDLDGPIQLNGHELTFQNDGGQTDVSGVISGAGGLKKRGPGFPTVLKAANTYSGTTYIEAGALQIQHNTALGSPASGTILSGGVLRIHGGAGITVSEPFTFNGGHLRDDGGNNSITGNIILNTDTTVDVGAELTLSGVISGPGDLKKIHAGKLVLSGTSANTYAGITRVEEGELVLDKTPFLVAVSGPLIIGDGDSEAATVTIMGGSIADNAPVLVNTDGTLVVSTADNIGSLEGTGSVEIAGANSFLRVNVNVLTEFNGSISGPGALEKYGGGTMILSGPCSHGSSKAGSGTLVINSSHGGAVTVVSGATLGGHGTIGGDVTVNGTLNPGPGGPLTVNGDVQANPGSQFIFDLSGPTAGIDYDQLSVVGDLLLNNNPQLTVNLAPNFTPAVNDEFVIMAVANGNLSPGFSGLGDLAPPFLVNGLTFQMDYYANGNDVVLRCIAPPSVAAPVMAAGGTMLISGQFAPDQTVMLEASDLVEPIRWVTVATARTGRDGSFRLSDPEALRFSRRFYRVRSR
jgi:autotransporter-associated beta strand protein